MKKRILSLVLCAVLLMGLCACRNTVAENPEPMPELPKASEVPDVEIALTDFIDGSHKRSDEYMAAFKTKGVSLDGIRIEFASDMFDETSSPEIAESMAETYYALKALSPERVSDVTVYIVKISADGGPVLLGNRLYISEYYVESGAYRTYLAGVACGVEEHWKRLGLGLLANAEMEEGFSAADLESYIRERESTGILSLHPCYFIKGFADEATRELAMDCARALSEFIIREYGFEAFVSDSGSGSRARWLKSIGLDYDVSWLDEAPARRLHGMAFSEIEDVAMLLDGDRYYLSPTSVDWVNDANSLYALLLDFSQQVESLFGRLKKEAPVYWDWLENMELKTSLQFRDSNYPVTYSSEVLMTGRMVRAYDDMLPETMNILIPYNLAVDEEIRWLGEGINAYLTSPYIPVRHSDIASAFLQGMPMNGNEEHTKDDFFFENEVSRCFELLNGCEISELEEMENALYLLYEACGYAALLSPENESLPEASLSMKEQFSLEGDYPGNELSRFEAMVFAGYLVEKYGLDMMICSTIDTNLYFRIFPNADFFRAEYYEFYTEKVAGLGTGSL